MWVVEVYDGVTYSDAVFSEKSKVLWLIIKQIYMVVPNKNFAGMTCWKIYIH